MGEPQRILAMVGDLFFAVRVADVIRGLGHTPQLVETAEALRAGMTPAPALVLLDLALVERWEVALRTLRADPEHAAVPVLAFGAHLDVAAQRRGRDAGVSQIVANSKFAADLPSLIERLLA